MENQERMAFVCYPSFLDAIEKMPTDELKGQAALALLRLGVDGEWDDTNPFIDMFLTLVTPNITAAKDRYKAAVENGKKGGRPSKVDKDKVKELFVSGMSNQDIANECDCSVDYVRKLTKELASQKNQKKEPFSGYNLNIDIDKDNNTDNDKDKDEGVRQTETVSAQESGRTLEQVAKVLKSQGKSDEWIACARSLKRESEWAQYGYGLMQFPSFQQQVDSEMTKREALRAKQEQIAASFGGALSSSATVFIPSSRTPSATVALADMKRLEGLDDD